jgi:hypothetical protein
MKSIKANIPARIDAVALPPFLSGKPLIQERQDLRNVELYVLKVEVLLVIFLHFEKIIQFQVKLQETTVTT